MRNTDKLLFDIADAARLVEMFLAGIDRPGFDSDVKTQSAVLYQLAIVGEAVKLLPEEWRSQHPAIPWNQIGRMRDHLIHRYFSVDLDVLWHTATVDISELRKYLTPLVSPLLQDEPQQE